MAKKKKKKLSKKEKAKLAEAEAKRKAAEEEAERIRLQKEEKERRKREAQEAKERAQREVVEHQIRVEQLGNSCKRFEEYKKTNLERNIALREEEEWQLHLQCNGLPNPANLAEMNTYLHIRKQDEKINFIDENLPKTHEVLNLLSDLDNLIDKPLNIPQKTVENWKEVRNKFREELQERLDNSSFNILRELEKNMTAVDLETVTYLKECPDLTLCMWTVLKIPRALSDCRPPPFIEFPKVGVNIQLPPKFTHIFLVVRVLWLKYDHFSDLCRTWEAKPLPGEYSKDLNELKTFEFEEKQRIKAEQEAEEAARLEKSMKKKKKWWEYDPLPEETEAAPEGAAEAPPEAVPEAPPDTTSQTENTSAGENKPAETSSSKGIIEPTTSSTGQSAVGTVTSSTGRPATTPTSSVGKPALSTPTSINPEPAVNSSSTTISTRHEDLAPGEHAEDNPDAPPKRPSQIMEERELKRINDLRNYLEVELEPGELNMRKYVVLGGVFHLDLLEQPPQYKVLNDRTLLTVFEGEQKLHHIEYYEDYNLNLPVPDSESTGEEIEGEEEPPMDEAELEAALEQLEKEQKLKLVEIHISLPDSVLWFEPPFAVQWNSQKKIWTTNDIHDPTYDEENKVLSFKTGLMAPAALATFRFINLPYKKWEMRPNWEGPPGEVFFSITAATVIVDFVIRANQVCIYQLQNATSTALEDMERVFYSPHQLIRKMRQGGIDLFPEHDAYLYVEEVTEKHYMAENHLYHCMAHFCTTYNFEWSRWNQEAGSDNMIMQMREFIDHERLRDFQMLQVTPQRACIVDCTELSEAFSPMAVEGMKFYPDLYTLVNEYASSISKERIESMDLALMETVYYMLTSTRVLSYCCFDENYLPNVDNIFSTVKT